MPAELGRRAHAGPAEMFVLAAHLSLLLNLKRNGGGEKNERQVNDLFGVWFCHRLGA